VAFSLLHCFSFVQQEEELDTPNIHASLYLSNQILSLFHQKAFCQFRDSGKIMKNLNE